MEAASTSLLKGRVLTGIWHDTGHGLESIPAEPFSREKDLHDSIEQAPAMLPLPGQPRLVVLGREVGLGNGSADLVAVDAVTGQPVVIEVKLASNSDRRSVFTQVLGYAAALYRLTLADFEDALRPHLARRGYPSIVDAVCTQVTDLPLDRQQLQQNLADALARGLTRSVVVIDAAPTDLIELTGYLQAVTNDKLLVDLVTVSAYAVGESRVLVPQLVEPGSHMPEAGPIATRTPASKPIRGWQAFEDSIDQAASKHQAVLRRLYGWARQLEFDGLATLFTTTGKGRWVLNPRLPGQERGLVTVWNDNGGYLCTQRSVIESESPRTCARLDEALPGEIRNNAYIRSELTDAILTMFTDAYAEAAARRATAPPSSDVRD